MATYRAFHIPEHSIAMMPTGGYVSRLPFSVDSIRWLDYVSATESIVILHGANGNGEQKVAGHFVDGFCRENATVYLYHVSFSFALLFRTF